MKRGLNAIRAYERVLLAADNNFIAHRSWSVIYDVLHPVYSSVNRSSCMILTRASCPRPSALILIPLLS